MKNQTTLKITTGALMIAIFTIMLIINRQTGSLFEEMILYLMPMPLTAYAVKYDWKNSIPVMVAMVLMSFLFGTLTTIFYAATECLIGLIFGTCLYRKADPTKTLFAVILLSVIANVLNTIVLASFFGFDLQQDIAEIQGMLDQIIAISGTTLPENLFTYDALLQMMVVSMIFLGMIQGYVIYALTLLVLRRIGFQVQKPQSIYNYQPARWTGPVAAILLFGYILIGSGSIQAFQDQKLTTLFQTIGMCAYYYLIFFGILFTLLYLSHNGIRAKGIRVLLVAGLTLFFPWGEAILGIVYILSDYRQQYLKNLPVRKTSQN